MYHYKSAYIQKGHGLGGIFRGIRNFFMPLARRVVTTLNKPEVKRVLKTIGKETLNTGSELVLDSIQGNDIQSTLNKRISTAKKRIAESIEDGIKSKRTVNSIKRYQRLLEMNFLTDIIVLALSPLRRTLYLLLKFTDY